MRGSRWEGVGNPNQLTNTGADFSPIFLSRGKPDRDPNQSMPPPFLQLLLIAHCF